MLELLQTPEVLTAIGGIVTGVLTTLLVMLRKKAKETENKLDDELVKVVDKAVNDSKEQ